MLAACVVIANQFIKRQHAKLFLYYTVANQSIASYSEGINAFTTNLCDSCSLYGVTGAAVMYTI